MGHLPLVAAAGAPPLSEPLFFIFLDYLWCHTGRPERFNVMRRLWHCDLTLLEYENLPSRGKNNL
jgi:hypothetical protein